jgi:hypothetical protein
MTLQGQEVVGAEDTLRQLATASLHQPIAHAAARQDSLALRLQYLERGIGFLIHGALGPAEAVRHLSDGSSAANEGEPAAAGVQQVSGGKVPAGVVVHRH